MDNDGVLSARVCGVHNSCLGGMLVGVLLLVQDGDHCRIHGYQHNHQSQHRDDRTLRVAFGTGKLEHSKQVHVFQPVS